MFHTRGQTCRWFPKWCFRRSSLMILRTVCNFSSQLTMEEGPPRSRSLAVFSTFESKKPLKIDVLPMVMSPKDVSSISCASGAVFPSSTQTLTQISFFFIIKSRIGLNINKNKHSLRGRQRVMAAKLTRLIYQIAIRRVVASESCRLITFCCRFWRWVLKLLDTPSRDNTEEDTECDLW